jgi:hypothetical protein
MKRTAFMVLGCIAAIAPAAYASESMTMFGQSCQWVSPGNPGHSYITKGIENTDTDHYDDISCPGVMALPLGSLVVIDSVHVDYHDGSNGGNVDCFVEDTNWDGTTYVSADQYSSDYFVGNGTLSFGHPISQTNLYPINISLYCHLGGRSWITGWDLTIN